MSTRKTEDLRKRKAEDEKTVSKKPRREETHNQPRETSSKSDSDRYGDYYTSNKDSVRGRPKNRETTHTSSGYSDRSGPTTRDYPSDFQETKENDTTSHRRGSNSTYSNRSRRSITQDYAFEKNDDTSFSSSSHSKTSHSQDRGRSREKETRSRNTTNNRDRRENVYDKIKEKILKQDKALPVEDQMLIKSKEDKNNTFVADRPERGKVGKDGKALEYDSEKTKKGILKAELGEKYSSSPDEYFENSNSSKDKAKSFMEKLFENIPKEKLESDKETSEINIAIVPIRYINKNDKWEEICLIGISGSEATNERLEIWEGVRKTIEALNQQNNGNKFLLIENYNRKALHNVLDYVLEKGNYGQVDKKNCSEKKLLHFIFKLSHHTLVDVEGWTNCVLAKKFIISSNSKYLHLKNGNKVVMRDCCLNCQKSKPAAISYLRFPIISKGKYKRELSPLRDNFGTDVTTEAKNFLDNLPQDRPEKKEPVSEQKETISEKKESKTTNIQLEESEPKIDFIQRSAFLFELGRNNNLYPNIIQALINKDLRNSHPEQYNTNLHQALEKEGNSNMKIKNVKDKLFDAKGTLKISLEEMDSVCKESQHSKYKIPKLTTPTPVQPSSNSDIPPTPTFGT